MTIKNRRQFLSKAIGISLMAALAISGCGFEMRQTPQLAFKKLWMSGDSGVLGHIRRDIAEQRIQVEYARGAFEADVFLEILNVENIETVVGQTPSGQVREKQLKVKATFKLWVKGDETEHTEEVLEQYRESSYSETLALAKGEEENLLYNDMRKSIAEQLVWRLSKIQPIEGIDEEEPVESLGAIDDGIEGW